MAYIPISQSKATGGYRPIGNGPVPTPRKPGAIARPKTFGVMPEGAVLTPEPRNAEVPFDATARGIALNTLRGLPKAAADTLVEIGQGSLRAYAAIGGAVTRQPLTPQGQFQKDLFGTDKPITFGSVGREVIGEKAPDALSVPVGIALGVGDLFGGGSKAAKGLSSIDDLVRAARAVRTGKAGEMLLKDAGVADDIIRSLRLGDKLADANTDDAIRAVIREADEAGAFTRAASTATDAPTPARAADAEPAPVPRSAAPRTPETPTVTRAADAPAPRAATEALQATDEVLEVPPELLTAARKFKSADEFVEAQKTKSPSYAVGEGSGHTAPYRGEGFAPAHALDELYPKDVYEKGAQYYGSGFRDLDNEAMEIFRNIRGNPDAEITIYRAVPKGNNIKDINAGDWVTVTRGYAETHGKSNLGGNYDILTKTVKADELFTEANSLQEFGYDPRQLTKSQLIDIWNKANAELPTLPKLPQNIIDSIKSGRADDTIREALLSRYSELGRRPPTANAKIIAEAKNPPTRSGLGRIADELLTPISSRLERINPKLKWRVLRKFEHKVAQQTVKDQEAILPFLQKARKMPVEDQALFDLARKNSDTELIDALAVKYDMVEEVNQVRKTLADLHKRATEAGMDVGKIEDYWPRVVTNPEKFMAYLRGTDEWGKINELINAEATKKGVHPLDLTDEERSALVNNFIRGYGDRVTLSAPGFTESRTLKVIDEELNQFYETSDNALSTYVIRMNDEIEARKFFGKALKTDVGDASIESSIGSYVMDLVAKGELSPSQEQEVVEIFRARFHRGKMNGALDVYRNLEYLSTMGSPISAITQIGDIGYSLYTNGFYDTLVGVRRALSKNKLSKEAIGVENITQEFSRQTMSGRALDQVFKINGLSRLDRLGKETLINGYLSKAKRLANRGDDTLKRELDLIFDADEAAMALEELKRGELTDRTKELAFNKLLDFQPVAKSEMPQKYLEHPNGRLFYMLKSFTLKQIDVMRREAFDHIASGDPKRVKQGFRNLVLLGGTLMAANATADEIKDQILGRETPLSDRLVDNLWRLVGATKFDVYKARQEGVGQTVMKKILFPTSLVDRGYRDVANLLQGKEYEIGPNKGDRVGLESTQSIPIAGKLYYWWFGRGAQKERQKEGGSSSSSGIPELPELPKLPTLPKLPKL